MKLYSQTAKDQSHLVLLKERKSLWNVIILVNSMLSTNTCAKQKMNFNVRKYHPRPCRSRSTQTRTMELTGVGSTSHTHSTASWSEKYQYKVSLNSPTIQTKQKGVCICNDMCCIIRGLFKALKPLPMVVEYLVMHAHTGYHGGEVAMKPSN